MTPVAPDRFSKYRNFNSSLSSRSSRYRLSPKGPRLESQNQDLLGAKAPGQIRETILGTRIPYCNLREHKKKGSAGCFGCPSSVAKYARPQQTIRS